MAKCVIFFSCYSKIFNWRKFALTVLLLLNFKALLKLHISYFGENSHVTKWFLFLFYNADCESMTWLKRTLRNSTIDECKRRHVIWLITEMIDFQFATLKRYKFELTFGELPTSNFPKSILAQVNAPDFFLIALWNHYLWLWMLSLYQQITISNLNLLLKYWNK